MLKLELVLRTPMKMERGVKETENGGNTRKRGQLWKSRKELSRGMGVILLWFVCSSAPKKSKM